MFVGTYQLGAKNGKSVLEPNVRLGEPSGEAIERHDTIFSINFPTDRIIKDLL